MSKEETVKRYEKDGFTIVWRPGRCIHSEICVKTLPKVYRPGEKPWIQPSSATIPELRAQIDRCPSGALAYEQSGAGEKETRHARTEVRVVPGGPLMITGPLQLQGTDGTMETLEGKTALCRCGGSGRKPFCDGSHKKISFE